MGKWITIEFTRPKRFRLFSWMVRQIQKTEYSHVRLSWLGAGGSVPVIYEASGSNIKFIGPEAQQYHPVEIIKTYKVNIGRDDYRKLVQLCMTFAGVRYGVKQVIGMALVRVFALDKNPFADGRKSQVCSEVVGHFIENILGHKVGVSLDIAGPKEIDEALAEYTALKVVDDAS